MPGRITNDCIFPSVCFWHKADTQTNINIHINPQYLCHNKLINEVQSVFLLESLIFKIYS